jgi:hypothetical protein
MMATTIADPVGSHDNGWTSTETAAGLGPHRARLSRVVTAALLSEVAEVVALPDLRAEVPEDRVRN